MEYKHYVPVYFKQPDHPITVAVIGCGGNGSRMLVRLAEIHQALIQLDHPGLYVAASDPDTVSQTNIGRQGFYPADIGRNKAEVLISRINRSFGLHWSYETTPVSGRPHANIVISCVDNVSTRINLHNAIVEKYGADASKKKRSSTEGGQQKTYYWIDFGNSKASGQIVMGTTIGVKQPDMEECVAMLPTITDLVPNLMDHEDVTEPSCSMAEALMRQDLTINNMMAAYGQKIVWSLFKDHYLKSHGVYINLETFDTNAIKIQPYALPLRRRISTDKDKGSQKPANNKDRIAGSRKSHPKNDKSKRTNAGGKRKTRSKRKAAIQ